MGTLGKGLTASALGLLLHATAAHAASLDGAVDETPSRWFVELASPPAEDGGAVATLRAEKDAFRREARAVVGLRERRAFDRLFNGLSVEVPRAGSRSSRGSRG